MTTQGTFWKDNPGDSGQWEAAGLRWLGEAMPSGGARVVQVHSVTDEGLAIDAVSAASPTPEAAERFGRALSATHSYGAPSFGASPWGAGGGVEQREEGKAGFQGPNDQLLEFPLQAFQSWGAFYATVCLEPLVDRVRHGLSSSDNANIDALLERLHGGDFDDDQQPARIHGDLWSGNVLWGSIDTPGNPGGGEHTEGILIDPVAHGGHPETDLAALDMFGAPYLERILGTYEETGTLQPGWRARVPLHQQYIVWLHAALFGGGYIRQALNGVEKALRL